MGIFKRKKGKSKIQFSDLEGQPLKAGDHVMSHRYDMGNAGLWIQIRAWLINPWPPASR